VPIHRLFPVTIPREIHRLGREPWAPDEDTSKVIASIQERTAEWVN